MQVKRGRGYVYAIEYHIVWRVKYRLGVLSGRVAETLKELLNGTADEYGFGIEALEVEKPLDVDRKGDFYAFERRLSKVCRASTTSPCFFQADWLRSTSNRIWARMINRVEALPP